MDSNKAINSLFLSGIFAVILAHMGQAYAKSETKNSLDGTWCTTEEGSFIFYEHKRDAVNLGKGDYCRTFKVLTMNKSGGGGRFIDTLKKPDIKNQIGGIEESRDGVIYSKDIGIFVYSKKDEAIHMITIDVSDETVSELTIDSSGVMHGFVREVTSDSTTYETLVGVLFFKKNREPIPSKFNQDWELIFNKTHKKP
ncbi:hypothetical protein [Microbulbifer variabilis]|uniref:hypothetical protein n=1 Tax=Microbulbifer variabilis TaxID=266805 RepID=UPI001CFD478E|nr:hypothetical protein [Microbulbifer variabilis]